MMTAIALASRPAQPNDVRGWLAAAAAAVFLALSAPAAADTEVAPEAAAPVSDSRSADCRDAIDRTRPQYIIGYGSLMNRASKQRTAPQAGYGRPVRVTGWERGFFAPLGPIASKTTFLGVRAEADAEMVASLYRMVDVEEFIAQDRREVIYCRRRVEPETIETLDGSMVPGDGQIWLYELDPSDYALPTADYPIVQSYVDLFLGGCFELSALVLDEPEAFPRACVETTTGWSAHWVNDRVHPRRAFATVPFAREIDSLIRDTMPDLFDQITIE